MRKTKGYDSTDEWFKNRKELESVARDYLPNYLQSVLSVDNLSKNFRCPLHSDSTPSMTYYADSQVVHCHAGCGTFNIFRLHAKLNGRYEPIKQDFDDIFEMYNLITPTGRKISKPKIKPIEPPPTAKKLIVDRSKDIAKYAANIEKTDYWSKRGLTLDTVKHFNLGFCADWKHPDFETPKQARLIIPTGDGIHSYAARRIDNILEYKILKVGGKVLFNLDGFNDDYVIISEGEFDAMSIWQAGFQNTVGLGGVGNKDKFIEKIKSLESKPKFVIIALDNDNAGIETAQWINNELNNLNIYSLIVNDIFGEYKDANVLLQHDSELLKTSIQNSIDKANKEYENWTPPIAVDETTEQTNSEIDEFDKQSAIQAAETQKAVDILQSITDFSKDIIYSEEVLHAAALCYVYAIKDFEEFREKADKHGIRVGLLDSKVKTYAKPIQKEKDRREKQRWNKIKEDEYKQKEKERERHRLDNVTKLQELSNNEDIEPDKIIELIRQSLERDHKGKILQNTRNFNLIIYNDPYIKNAVGFNAFNNRMTPLKKLPWQDELVKVISWNDSDDEGMQNYIDINYNLRSDKIFKGAIDEYAHKHSFHPIRDFFNNLPKWDGIARAETVFIDALDVEDSEYARKVSLHWLLGGVARIFNPGCKFDYTLVTKGKQGIGKSTILGRLAVNRDWFNDSLDSFEGKDALEQLQGSWIIEIGEMQATKKSDNEKIKSFISRQVDEFRKAYGHRKESYPRQCIFSATTNSEEFLKDRTGGRRFLILVSEAKTYTIKKRMEKFTPDYILQIWAEVYHIYNEMFKDGFDDSLLDIPANLKNIAKEYQDRYTEGGALAGAITEYLDKEYPINWESLPKLKRRMWIRGDENVVDCTVLKKRDLISAHEIAFEMLNIDNPGKDSATIREIGEVIANLAGWQRFEKPKRIKEYGVQKVIFQRLKNPLADD